jgi:hypothetical protein
MFVAGAIFFADSVGYLVNAVSKRVRDVHFEAGAGDNVTVVSEELKR